MISFRHVLAALLPLTLIACNYNAKAPGEEAAQVSDYKTGELVTASNETGFLFDSLPLPPGANEQKQGQHPVNTASAPNPDWDKKIIKNAFITLEVADYKKFNQLVHTTARQWGGYIAQEEQHESGYKIENTVTIKVPVHQFDIAVNAVSPVEEKVISKKITSQDVTGEVVDTRSRMEAKRQVRLRYLDLLKQAKNMEEILQVQNVINDIQVQIESAAGRVNYLTHASSFSTIQLTFYQVLNEQAQDTHEPGFGTRIFASLKTGFDFIGELIIVLLTLWPLWMVAGFAWWGVKKWRKKPVGS